MSWVMPASPAGRNIEPLEGDPGTIVQRGRAIEDLGNEMVASAAFLRRLVDEADGQSGQAIEKLREIVGDTHEQLKRAGDMYRPTGPILVSYGNTLSSVQPRVHAAVNACETQWRSFQAAPGFMPGERPFWARAEPDSDEAKDEQRHDRNKQAAYENFIDAARGFDREVDTWEDAFESAANGVGDVLEGSIKDSFWDNADGFVDRVLMVLSWAGLVVAVLSIIIGGPLFALISSVIGVVTLLLTTYQVARGDAGRERLVISLISLMPFGKLGKLWQGKPGVTDFFASTVTAFRPSAWSAASGQLGNITRNLGTAWTFSSGGAFRFVDMGRTLWQTSNPNSVGDVLTRFMFGRDTRGLTALSDALDGAANGWWRATGPAAWEFSYTLVSGAWGVGDKIAQWTNNPHVRPSSQFPWIGAFL